MRARHGVRFPWVSLVTVFGVQGLVMWVVALPLQARQDAPLTWHAWSLVGIGLWSIGFCFETVGDLQLARFKSLSENQGKVMDRGFGRLSRHPNYFGNALVWSGLAAIAQDEMDRSWALISPVVMTFFRLRVSGMRLLERTLTSRKAGYQDYIQRTSSFFPWPPRS
ncbi:MAG: hypothetical protein CMJ59_08900 [Planctomycetaceae bacterium]|nr:hypothetical protein [Planctomycetaceae bacterium]